jgi:hypothetical protein
MCECAKCKYTRDYVSVEVCTTVSGVRRYE